MLFDIGQPLTDDTCNNEQRLWPLCYAIRLAEGTSWYRADSRQARTRVVSFFPRKYFAPTIAQNVAADIGTRMGWSEHHAQTTALGAIRLVLITNVLVTLGFLEPLDHWYPHF